MPPINYDNRYPVLYAQNISRNDSSQTEAGDSAQDLEKLEAFARQNMFPLKFELNKLPVMVREPKKKDNPNEDDPRYNRADNLGRLGPNDMAQRKKIAKSGLALFKALRLHEKAKANIESVKLFVQTELAKDKIKLSDIVNEDVWLASEKNIETLILNHVELGSETGAVDKKTNQPLREIIITKRQNRYSFKSTSEVRHIEFLKMLDVFFNDGVYNGQVLKDTLPDTRVLALNQFLSNQVHKESLTVNKEGTSIKADLEMKTQNLTARQRTLVAYYLWALAEYARVNTRQFILLTHSNYDSIDLDEETLGKSVYLQNMRYLYNVLADCTGNTYDLILEINKNLDPDIAATMTLLDKIRDGDEAIVSGAFVKAKEAYDAAADQNAKRRNKSPEDFYSVAIAVRLNNLKQATRFTSEMTGRINPERDKNRKIVIHAGNASADSLMGRVLKASSDKDLPQDFKNQTKKALDEIVEGEYQFLNASDEKKVKVQVHNSDANRTETSIMTEREYLAKNLEKKIEDLKKKLSSSADIKDQQVNVKRVKEQFNEAKRFADKHAGEPGVLANTVERDKAEQHARILESIPEKTRKTAGLDGYDHVLNRLKRLYEIPAPNAKTISKDLDYLFNNLRDAFRAYVNSPTSANLKSVVEAYVPVILLMETDSETKSLLQKALSVDEISGEKFWKNAFFDPTGQNIFQKTYQQKTTQAENTLIEAYVSGSKTEKAFYRLSDIRTVIKNDDSLVDGEKRALVARITLFFRDDIGRMLGIQDLSDLSEPELMRVVYGIGRLMNASGAVSASQLKANFEKHLDKELIEIGAADFRFSAGESIFKHKGDLSGLAPIQSKLDEKNAKNYKGNSAELFFADIFLAFDPNVKGGLSGTESAMRLSLELNNETIPRSAMSLSIKAGYCETRAVLKKDLILLRNYVNQDKPSDVRGKQFKKIRLALIEALADSLQIKLD